MNGPFEGQEASQPKQGDTIKALPLWSTNQFIDSRKYNEQQYIDKHFTFTQPCDFDGPQTQLIQQSFGALDPYMSKIWWKNANCGDAKVYNHIGGPVDNAKLSKHLDNGDLFIINSKQYGAPSSCAAVIVPPAVSAKFNTKLDEESADLIRKYDSTDKFSPLNYFFGKYDLPVGLEYERANILENTKPDIALAWTAATAVMIELSPKE